MWIPIALGLSCWGLYLLDRLLDAHRSLRAAYYPRMRERHLHHWRLRRMLFPLALAALFTAGLLALWQMPRPALLRNGILAAAALVYFFAVHSRRRFLHSAIRFKELMVALIFTAACTVPVIARVHGKADILAASLAYAALAWLNCYAIESWEQDATTAFTAAVRSICIIAAAALLFAATLLFKAQPYIVALLLCAAASAAMLFLLDRRRNAFSPLTLRIVADLALLTPVFLLLPGIRP